jgi:hypothetical protein
MTSFFLFFLPPSDSLGFFGRGHQDLNLPEPVMWAIKATSMTGRSQILSSLVNGKGFLNTILMGYEWDIIAIIE